MDTEGIDISVLFPTSGFGITQTPERGYAAAYCRAYNDWVATVCSESPRLKAVALVPFQDVDAACREIQRAMGQLDLAGITVATFGLKEHIGQPQFWPIYQELEKLDKKVAELKEKAEKATGDAKASLEAKWKESAAKREAAGKKLEELKAAAADKWEAVKKDADKTVEDLKKSAE